MNLAELTERVVALPDVGESGAVYLLNVVDRPAEISGAAFTVLRRPDGRFELWRGDQRSSATPDVDERGETRLFESEDAVADEAWTRIREGRRGSDAPQQPSPEGLASADRIRERLARLESGD